ncbi:hypothetical protein P170DRAFT_481366 [Aspergillus steynii IBT 23096]|uniref:Uncharacterized protein n=1 Tax=Aspergillus steynii IBT 23096 TaxID=1392250 RepID=A0A2I2FS30_9EURO|nr:uncharacterized protein P170DRAFT_481366 [Aspergillus steynii IBT 23096]PLB43419.1 hypothetical protein P170DRAFT_481366 [Aspergillus steynii IBT 23096]
MDNAEVQIIYDQMREYSQQETVIGLNRTIPFKQGLRPQKSRRLCGQCSKHQATRMTNMAGEIPYTAWLCRTCFEYQARTGDAPPESVYNDPLRRNIVFVYRPKKLVENPRFNRNKVELVCSLCENTVSRGWHKHPSDTTKTICDTCYKEAHKQSTVIMRHLNIATRKAACKEIDGLALTETLTPKGLVPKDPKKRICGSCGRVNHTNGFLTHPEHGLICNTCLIRERNDKVRGTKTVQRSQKSLEKQKDSTECFHCKKQFSKTVRKSWWKGLEEFLCKSCHDSVRLRRRLPVLPEQIRDLIVECDGCKTKYSRSWHIRDVDNKGSLYCAPCYICVRVNKTPSAQRRCESNEGPESKTYYEAVCSGDNHPVGDNQTVGANQTVGESEGD